MPSNGFRAYRRALFKSTTSSVNVAVTALFIVISNVFWLIASGARQKGQSVHSFVQPFFPTLGIVYKVLNQFGSDSEIPPTLSQNAAVRYGSDDHPYNVNPEQHTAIAEEDFLKKDPAEISAYVTNGRIKSSDDCHRNYEWEQFWKMALTKLFVHKFHESKKYMDILRKNGIDDQTEIIYSRESYWGDRKPKRHSNLSNYWAVFFFGANMTPELVEILKKKHRKQPEPDTTDLWASALSG
eukprot:CAMPEP_0178719810 /NCGR_PEP_ID=MMETSP0699-20121125/23363_1 /TAXON_ID=265572 /ORGANISM="Extubocellulus spinifer, Strain CCMP396" /LENGTH=239 /DNA_ID=CAMNT_0020370151 /DNA_START=195 /DNA_END=915 /DNA_ORIENTATION=+